MAVKIAYLLLGLAAACSCLDGGVGGHSEFDPRFRLGLAALSRNDPEPKIEPMAQTRVHRRSPNYHPFVRSDVPSPRPRNNINFGFRVGPGTYGPRIFYPIRPIPRRPIPRRPIRTRPIPTRPIPTRPIPIRPIPTRPIQRPPILIEPLVNVPTNIYRDVIYVDQVRPVIFQPGPLNPGFRPGMNNGPFYHNHRPIGGSHPSANGPVHGIPQHPGQGENMHPGGLSPMQPNNGRPDFNRANNNSRDGSQKNLPEGTVGVSVAAVNQTEQGSVHANVTVFVVPKKEDNKETLQTAAQSFLDGIFNKHKGEEQKRKASNNLEDVLNRIDVH